MKVKEIFEIIESTNKLQEVLQSNSRASVQLYVEDKSIGHECHTFKEFKYALFTEYNELFIAEVMSADFIKTYNNTLGATLELKIASGIYKSRVELFVDMGGF